ncbi:uncharacterized protein LOC111267154 [Varroa jacobsoni]|uniref:Uncharacterized protein n=1 Tax=Varroa destructor TaxID=109461 RepID=A0A7M7JDZ1_VARDE|nr:uncharacterized protein LOC111245861 [Varroa destructor]XP_022700933.1 uncharacterized protein LOC111267154 [Varroa jacobsoni]
MRYYRSRTFRRCTIYVAVLCIVLLVIVGFLQKEAANGCGTTEDAHPCLEKLFPLVLKSLQSLDISLHYLCYYSLWGALKIGEPLPWTNRIELCVQNEELLAKADEGSIVKTFRRHGLEVRYDSANGLYYAWHDADVRCQVYLYVFESQDGQSAWRVGWKHRLKSSKVCEGTTCFPARLVKAPLKQLDFMGLRVNVPHEEFEIQKYLYPDSWWKDVRAPNC